MDISFQFLIGKVKSTAFIRYLGDAGQFHGETRLKSRLVLHDNFTRTEDQKQGFSEQPCLSKRLVLDREHTKTLAVAGS